MKSNCKAIVLNVLAAMATVLLPSVARTQTWTSGSSGSIYYSGGNVGIGVTNPETTLHVFTGASQSPTTGVAVVANDGHRVSIFPSLGPGSYNGVVQAGDVGIIYSNGTIGTGGLVLSPWANGVSGVRIDANGNVGIGTSNPTYPLTINGTARAKEIIVDTGWSDYVFDNNYHLTPLKETAAFIKQHHHLPGIPSAAEVKNKGISVGEMQAKLLAKIEELTLLMIQERERNDQLARENREIKQRVATLDDLAAY